MKNYRVKLVPGAEGAAPTATVEERSPFQAAGDAIISLAKDDEASLGYVKTVVHGGLIYGGMLYAKYRQTGVFSYNPV